MHCKKAGEIKRKPFDVESVNFRAKKFADVPTLRNYVKSTIGSILTQKGVSCVRRIPELQL